MPAIPRRTYHYHAAAHAFSARFTRPIEHLIEVQAATSLPTIGGHGNSHVEEFRFQEFISFRRGYSHVSGSKSDVDGAYTTLVTSVIEGLNILDVITADRIVGRMASSHSAQESEPRITIVGSKLENLRIAGCKVEISLDFDLFERISTFAAARKELDSNPNFRKMALDPFQTGETIPTPGAQGVILCSCLKDLDASKCPGVKRLAHHALSVPEFGNIFLGEILLQHCERTLTMLRFDLGSPVCASGTAVQALSNGQSWPPSSA
jgi:hypothetical protein